MGHSLGSAIFFDVLCRQRERRTSSARNPLRIWPAARERAKDHDDMQFDFEVYDFYCLGSPVGLFQMLKGRTIAARHTPTLPPPSPPRPSLRPEDINSIFHPPNTHAICPTTGLPTNMSSPKVHQLFNIFHPSDPVSYRLEPLISPAMASLKPQALPYTKRSIFSVAPQGLTGIGARVGQSVSGLWSSLSAGIASNLLNRSLGISSDDAARLAAGQADGAAEADERKKRLAATEADETLIDDDLETLYSTFQRGRAVMREDAPDEGAKARKMRIEETKVRALNRNGRVDYNIQESALDFNPINTIASHMGYWADEDVSHFVLSQLLSNRSRPNKRKY
ncbi:hypothetical protein CDD82_527 [Ophiocordyceps australis]|uniref:DDHD domain-containing protein n=1 Tax=Ophiocordyceps australis TaxID=1399860 RepID=A0A2C5XRF1_9HYPO|nr:hypothetical protein CDD82_527 [Ophiocordyceps australis]